MRLGSRLTADICGSAINTLTLVLSVRVCVCPWVTDVTSTNESR